MTSTVAMSGEQNERECEAEADVALASLAEPAGPDATGGDAEDEDLLEDIVVNSPEELGDEQGYKAPVEELGGGGHRCECPPESVGGQTY